MMGTDTTEKQLKNQGQMTGIVSNDGFNFDLWAKEVRLQMLAALQKRAETARF